MPTLVLLRPRDCLACFCSLADAPAATSQVKPPICAPPRVLWKSFRAGSNSDACRGPVSDSSGPRMVARASDFNESWFPILFQSVDSWSCFTNKHTPSKLEALTRSFATRLSFSRGLAVRTPRRHRESTYEQNGVIVRQFHAKSFLELLRTARTSLFSSRTLTSIDPCAW